MPQAFNQHEPASPQTPPQAIAGRHVVLDLMGVSTHLFDDAEILLKWLEQTLIQAGFRVLGASSHSFHPHGATGVVLLSESHASFHTYPEHRYIAFDLFGCGAGDLDEVIEAAISHWQPERVTRRDIMRGAAGDDQQS